MPRLEDEDGDKSGIVIKIKNKIKSMQNMWRVNDCPICWFW